MRWLIINKMESRFNHQDIEEEIKRKIDINTHYSCTSFSKKYFSTIMPPPNVTGSLHVGHALITTAQDTVIRFQRMQGKNCLWQVGLDHAGIATQMVVEKELNKNGQTKKDFSREEFIQKVWEWKEKSGSTIIDQLKSLGASGDWSDIKFTMDKNVSKTVQEVFIKLYEDGLIYQDLRLVNWDCKLQTAISDLEVEQKSEKNNFYYINYKIKEAKEEITIATTRPETMFGDMAIAINPKDSKNKHLIGKSAVIPIIEKSIPIIADIHADPTKGTGIVKITPAHDFNDFEVAKRNNIENFINILNKDGKLNENVPKNYQGLSIQQARKLIVEELQQIGQLTKIEKKEMQIPYGDRSGTVIEPFLTTQWYLDTPKISKQAIAEVENNNIQFLQENWKNFYLEWVKNLEPWCISRQLWWGHRIPSFKSSTGDIFVASSIQDAEEKAQKFYNTSEKISLTQDPDVLDTWFSSSLWAFVSLGWGSPNDDKFKHFFPSNVLITGYDIIFFWVARMIMMSLYFTGKIPFQKIYITPLVRDEKGNKMSKSKGNVIDPLTITKEYGTDSLRYTLIKKLNDSNTIKLSKDDFEISRNFITKIWNSTRFAKMNGAKFNEDFNPSTATLNINKWILTKLNHAKKIIGDNLNNYKFQNATNQIYKFIWNDFCDWYVEMSKNYLYQEDINPPIKEEINNTTGFVLFNINQILHPIMPFISEQLTTEIGYTKNIQDSLWQDVNFTDEQSLKEIDSVIEFITGVRSLRHNINIKPITKIDVKIESITPHNQNILEKNLDMIQNLAKIKNLYFDEHKFAKQVSNIIEDTKFCISLDNIADLQTEFETLSKEVEKLEQQLAKIKHLLENKNFIDNAPKELIEQNNKEMEILQKKINLKKEIILILK